LGPILERNHNAFECLQAFFIAFFDLDLHPYRIAGHELGQVGAPKLVGETLHNWMNRHSCFLIAMKKRGYVEVLSLHGIFALRAAGVLFKGAQIAAILRA
jgi:hypothetical protein